MSKSAKKIAFTQPGQERQPTVTVADEWVRGAAANQPVEVPEAAPAGKLARLTIDLPPELRDRFKAACAMQRTKMVDEIRRFIEQWTQEHRKP
jgi:ParG